MDKNDPKDIAGSLYKNIDESLEHFCRLLEKGEIDEAFKWQQEHRIPHDEIMPNVVDAFNKLKGKRNHREALQIGLKYQFEPTLINPLYLAEWNRLYNKGQYEDAAQWAKEQNLTDVELKRSSHKAYETYVKSGKIDDAIRVLNNFGLIKEELFEITLSEYNKAFEENDFIKAAKLGREFGFSLKRTSQAAIYETLNKLKTGEHKKAIEHLHEFFLLSDDVFEIIPDLDGNNLVKDLVQYLIEPSFQNDKLRLLDEFVKKSHLFDRTFDSHLLQGFRTAVFALAVKKHNSLLKDEDITSARAIRESFSLFNAEIPQKFFITVLDEAILYHKKLLDIDDIEGAVKIKEEYSLFTNDLVFEKKESIMNDAVSFVIRALEKQDFISVKLVIVEYKIPGYLISDSVFRTVFALFRQYHYRDILKIFDSVELDSRDDNITVNLLDVYQKFIELKEYIFAAEFSKKVKLAKSYTHDAAFAGWKVFFLGRNFSKALSIKTYFKLPGKITLGNATQMYWNLVNSDKYSEAAELRRNYRISLTIAQWIRELFKIIFTNKQPPKTG